MLRRALALATGVSLIALVLVLSGLLSGPVAAARLLPPPNHTADLPSALLPGETWSPYVAQPPARYLPSASYDETGQRLIVFAGWGSGGSLNDVWVLTLTETPAPVWTELSTVGTPPPARYGHSAIYDAANQRLIIFGGMVDTFSSNDVWALSLTGTPTWSQLTPAGTPPSERYRHTTVYDPVNQRMLVFGGDTADGYANDVWALSLTGTPAWSQVTPTGSPPRARYGHTTVYDPVNQRMLVFGGDTADGYANDVWALSLTGLPTWSQVFHSSSPPPGRADHAAVYDAANQRMVVFGGLGDSTYFADIWALSLAGSPDWSPLSPSGSAPSGRSGHAAAYDAAGQRLIAFGGYVPGTGNTSESWALSLAGAPTWSQPVRSLPPGRYSHSAVLDSQHQRLIVYGGITWNGVAADVWALSLGTTRAWSQLSPSGTDAPGPRYGHTAVYDPVNRRMVIFAGSAGVGNTNDVWALSLDGPPAWTQLFPAGELPTIRFGHSAIYDAANGRMIVFGGYSTNGYADDVWALSLTGPPAWTQLFPAGDPPPARYLHSAVYDPANQRMIVFGGYSTNGYANDVWALSLAGTPTWSPMVTNGDPPFARYAHAAVYDEVYQRMLIFGGYANDNHEDLYLDDVWALSLDGTPTWSLRSPIGTAPIGRSDAFGALLPVSATTQQWLLFGGRRWDSGWQYLDDTWALEVHPACYKLTVEVSPSDGGSVSVAPPPNCEDGTTYHSGTVVTLQATPSAGYDFVGWSGDATGLTASMTVTMTAPRTIQANFTERSHWVGEIVPDSSGAPVTITATTRSGDVSIVFEGLQSAGTVTVTISGQPPSEGVPPGFFPLGTNYRITESGLAFSSARVCFPYSLTEVAAAGLEEGALRLLHYRAGAWHDITEAGSPDTARRQICGVTNSFSPFIIGSFSNHRALLPVVLNG